MTGVFVRLITIIGLNRWRGGKTPLSVTLTDARLLGFSS